MKREESTGNPAFDAWLREHESEFFSYRDGYTGKHYTAWYCHLMNIFDQRYHACDCEYEPPYGLVISGGCPTHD